MTEKDRQTYRIINGDSFKVLDTLEENSIDSCVTDPPYGLTSITKRFGKDGSFARLSKGFMGKEWDGSGIEHNVDFWKKVYRVLKPGAYLLAFGGSRTFHRIACAIEDAGFEIRDTIMWLYGSGFPKSMNIGKALEVKEKIGNSGTRAKRQIEQSCDTPSKVIKQTNNGAMGEIIETTRKDYVAGTNLAKEWQGWGTCLKPAYEPIIVARKPLIGSVADNIMQYGVGGINIDECRIEFEKTQNPATNPLYRQQNAEKYKQVKGGELSNGAVPFTSGKNGVSESGRFPANVILTYDDTDFEEVCGGFPTGGKNGSIDKPYKINNQVYGEYGNCKPFQAYDDEGSASRYFYCAKASKKDRDDGLNMLESQTTNDGRKKDVDNAFQRGITLRKNIHPTVKPVELMQYLIRLITPAGGAILDPFNGSGSTGKAVAFENREKNKNYKYVGIELDKEYCAISEGRIDYALYKYQYDVLEQIEENHRVGQLSLFDD